MLEKETEDPPEFTDEELQAALTRLGNDARQQAFAAGHSVMVARKGLLVLLHANGTEEILGPIQ